MVIAQDRIIPCSWDKINNVTNATTRGERGPGEDSQPENCLELRPAVARCVTIVYSCFTIALGPKSFLVAKCHSDRRVLGKAEPSLFDIGSIFEIATVHGETDRWRFSQREK